jgi:hypothetical protein
MAAFEGYCGLYAFDPLASLFHFLTGDALSWWYHLSQHAQNVGIPLVWATVRTEFMRTYSPADRRTPAQQARQVLITKQCTMAQHASVSQYENAFRVLIRECPDMSVADQIVWFISGLSDHYRRQCATQMDGTDWPDLATLVAFALGVEAREYAVSTFSKPAKRLAAFSSAAVAPQDPIATPKRRRLDGPPGQSAKLAGAPLAELPIDVPGGLRNLWTVAQKKSWVDADGRAYTPASFMGLVQAKRCLQCHKARGAGPGQCNGHSDSSAAKRQKKKGKRHAS